MEEDGAGDAFTDYTDVFEIKNTPENIDKVNATGMYADVRVFDGDPTFIVETVGIWYKYFANLESYAEQELENFLMHTELSKEDVVILL
jgi:hypothetical protein